MTMNGGSAMVLVSVLAFACRPLASASSAEDSNGLRRRSTKVEHEPCDLNGPGAVALDADGDGRADLTSVRTDIGRCWGYDLNLDGGVDSWVYEDNLGKPLRRELDYDRDGIPDEIQSYVKGVLTESQRSTLLAGTLDTWHFYRVGRLVRTERDTNSDGIIDQWWSYRTPECPIIRSDLNLDGKPDPESTIDPCKDANSSAQEDGAAAQLRGQESASDRAASSADPAGEQEAASEARPFDQSTSLPKPSSPHDDGRVPNAQEDGDVRAPAESEAKGNQEHQD